MKIGIFYKIENQEINKLILEQCEKYGFTYDNENPDVVFAVGGDGTFLRSVHHYIDKLEDILFIGINNGTLGFFFDYRKEDIPSVFKMIKERSYKITTHPIIQGHAQYENSKESFYAINEIRIENPFHTLISDVLINGEKLETYRGNGLIVCTSLGSSAYNKSLGGSLIDNDLESLEITEIAGIENNVYRALGSSFVLKGDKTITFSGQLLNSVIGYDFSNIHKNENLLNVVISYSDKTFRIIHSPDYSYIQKIRKSFIL